MPYVRDGKWFGKVAAYICVVKFQKWGLPYAHCIFFLDPKSNQCLGRPENVDDLVGAKIPSAQN